MNRKYAISHRINAVLPKKRLMQSKKDDKDQEKIQSSHLLIQIFKIFMKYISLHVLYFSKAERRMPMLSGSTENDFLQHYMK